MADLVVVLVIIIVMIHILYDRSRNKNKEDMTNMPDTQNEYAARTDKETYADLMHKPCYRTDAQAVSRDNGPLHQTKKKDVPYYHVLNKTIDNSSVNSDSIMAMVKGYNNNKRNKNKHQKIVFPNNYEGRLTDPFDKSHKIKLDGDLDMKGALCSDPFKVGLADLHNQNNEEYDGCNLDNEMADTKRYLREYVLDGKDQCYCVTDPSKSEFTRSEIDAYREQQIEFRDKIGGTSADFVDPVDKMNEISMVGIKAKNQSIRAFYDSIVENKIDRKLKGNPELFNLNTGMDRSNRSNRSHRSHKSHKSHYRNPQIPSSAYTQTSNAGGMYLARDNWLYTNEATANGGMDVTLRANDPMIDSNLMAC